MGRLHQARFFKLITLLSKSEPRERSGATEARTVLTVLFPFKVKTISLMQVNHSIQKRSVFLALHLHQSFKFQFSVLGSKSRDKPRDKLHDLSCDGCSSASVAHPEFPRRLRQPIILSNFCRKLHKNERIWSEAEGMRPWHPLLDPLLL